MKENVKKLLTTLEDVSIDAGEMLKKASEEEKESLCRYVGRSLKDVIKDYGMNMIDVADIIYPEKSSYSARLGRLTRLNKKKMVLRPELIDSISSVLYNSEFNAKNKYSKSKTIIILELISIYL